MPFAQTLLDAALAAARRGWPVFPLRPGAKTPALHGKDRCPGTGPCAAGHVGWEQRATAEPSSVERCWSHDAYNIGLPAGRAEQLVIDLDVPKPGYVFRDGWNMLGISNGADVLAYLAERAGHPLPDTYTVRTPSGGTHLYFRLPRGVVLRNTAGILGPLVDTRGHGGYVVAAGSITAAGTYDLVDDREPVELPGWLTRALTPKPSQATSGREIPARRGAEIATGDHSRYVRVAVEREVNRVAGALPGARNKALFIASCALGQLVAGGVLTEHEVRVALEHASQTHVDAGAYSSAQRDKTITSGLRAGASRPRTLETAGRPAA